MDRSMMVDAVPTRCQLGVDSVSEGGANRDDKTRSPAVTYISCPETHVAEASGLEWLVAS